MLWLAVRPGETVSPGNSLRQLESGGCSSTLARMRWTLRRSVGVNVGVKFQVATKSRVLNTMDDEFESLPLRHLVFSLSQSSREAPHFGAVPRPLRARSVPERATFQQWSRQFCPNFSRPPGESTVWRFWQILPVFEGNREGVSGAQAQQTHKIWCATTAYARGERKFAARISENLRESARTGRRIGGSRRPPQTARRQPGRTR